MGLCAGFGAEWGICFLEMNVGSFLWLMHCLNFEQKFVCLWTRNLKNPCFEALGPLFQRFLGLLCRSRNDAFNFSVWDARAFSIFLLPHTFERPKPVFFGCFASFLSILELFLTQLSKHRSTYKILY